jgi:hypothetical protein
MQFTLFMIYGSPESVSEHDMAAAQEAFDRYAKELDAAGVLVSADVFLPGAATTVTVRDGEVAIADGPHFDNGESIAGAFIINAPSVDDAVAWAGKNPAAQWGCIEVQPSAVIFRNGSWRQA